MSRSGGKLPLVAVLAASLAVASCTGSPRAAPPPIDLPATVCPDGTVVAVNKPCEPARLRMHGPAAPVPGAKPGGTIRVLSGHPLGRSLDPTGVHSRGLIAIESDLIVRSLTQFVYARRSFSTVLAPDLATDLGVPNRNFTSWTFTLRKGIEFANGRSITPQDVKFAIERSFDRKSFPGGPTYSNAYFLHGRTYHGPYRSSFPYDGVVIHGRNLTIKMARPFPDLPYWMALPAMSPIPPGKASNPVTYRSHPWASGPYQVASYTPGRSLVLVRNPNWDPRTDPGRHQYVQRFVFDFHTPIDTRLTESLVTDTGSARTTLLMSNLSAHDYGVFKARAADRLATGPTQCTELWYPDNRKITNVEVRRALALAFPYKAAWRAGGSTQGFTRIPAWGTTPPGTLGRIQYNPLASHVPGATDPATARALLKRADALNYPVRFPYETDVPTSIAVKKQIVTALRQAGFNPHPVPLSPEAPPGVLEHQRDSLDVRSGTWCSDWPTSSLWVTQLFGSPHVRPVGSKNGNREHFSNSAVDKRIRANLLLPIAHQPAAGAALEKRIMMRFLPVIPLGYVTVSLAHGSRVHGAGIDNVRGEPAFENVWIAPSS